MSHRRRRRTSRRSSPPSFSISSEAAPTEQPDQSPIIIRYAETDEDVIAIHQFLLVVARPAMLAPVDGTASLIEIIRVAKEETAIMAIHDGCLVGTLGLVRANWWYAPKHFYLTDRWHFVLPKYHHGPVDRLLKAEAVKLAEMAELPFVDQGKIRPQKDGKTFLLMPRISGKSAIPVSGSA